MGERGIGKKRSSTCWFPPQMAVQGGLSMLKLGARNSVWLSHWVARPQVPGLSSTTASPETLAGCCLEVEKLAILIFNRGCLQHQSKLTLQSQEASPREVPTYK